MFLFWKSWLKNEPKKLYASVSILFFITIIVFLIAFIYGDSFALSWDTIPKLLDEPFLLENIHLGIFEIPLQINNYSVQEQYINNGIKIPTFPSVIWICFFVVIWSWLSAHLTYFKRWMYLGSMTLMTILIVTLRIDQLLILGGNSKLFVGITLLLNLGLSFYFFTFKKNTPIGRRFFSFLLINTALIGFFMLRSELPHPALSITNYGMMVPFILSIIFIFVVSNQIPHLFLYLIGKTNPVHSKTSIVHFIIITLIYLANLVLLIMKKAMRIEFDILYINAFLIFVVSALAGVWGLQKNSSIEKYIPFKKLGIGIYLGLGMLTFICMGYVTAIHNTPLINVYEDVIIYTHFAWGIAFLLYVAMNFHDYNRETPVYKLTFDDQDDMRMPIYIYRSLGYLVFIGLLMYVSIKPLKQAKAGYYNNIADVYIKSQKPKLGKYYYQKAIEVDYYNQKSLLSLAEIFKNKKEYSEYVYFLEQSNILSPSPEAYINLGHKLDEVKLSLKTLEILKDAMEIFPNNSQLKNNLALTFINLGVADTASILLSQVKEERIANTNMLSHWSNYLAKDSTLAQMDQRPDINYQINKFAAYNHRKKALSNAFQKELVPELDKTKPIDWQTASYLYEYTLNQITSKDSSSIPYINKYLSHPQSNQAYGLYLVLAKACYYFYNKDAMSGVNFMISQAGRDPTLFNNIVGTWLMQLGQYDKAVPYLESAVMRGMPEANFALGVAFTELGEHEKAEKLWANILREDELPAYMENGAKEMRHILATDPNDISGLNDREKYGMIYYKKTSLEQGQKIINSIKDDTYKALSIAKLLDRFLNNEEVANNLFEQSTKLKKIETWAASKLNLSKLKHLLNKKEYIKILNNIDKIPLIGYDTYYRPYFKGLSLLYLGKTEAGFLGLQQAIKATPFEEKIYLGFHHYYQATKQSDKKSYDILVRGIQYQSDSKALVEAFAFQCLDERIIQYADQSRDRLVDLMPPAEYQAFLQKYNARKKEIEDSIQKVIDEVASPTDTTTAD